MSSKVQDTRKLAIKLLGSGCGRQLVPSALDYVQHHGEAELTGIDIALSGCQAQDRSHEVVRFAHIAAGGKFSTREIHAFTAEALGMSVETYSLASLRYDLSKLRAKQLVHKVPRSRRYRLTRKGYCICLVFLKLFERIYAPLTAGLLQPLSGDSRLQQQKRTQLDQLYQRVVDDLNQLFHAVGLKIAA